MRCLLPDERNELRSTNAAGAVATPYGHAEFVTGEGQARVPAFSKESVETPKLPPPHGEPALALTARIIIDETYPPTSLAIGKWAAFLRKAFPMYFHRTGVSIPFAALSLVIMCLVPADAF